MKIENENIKFKLKEKEKEKPWFPPWHCFFFFFWGSIFVM
jgi:hypothetical protein